MARINMSINGNRKTNSREVFRASRRLKKLGPAAICDIKLSSSRLTMRVRTIPQAAPQQAEAARDPQRKITDFYRPVG